MNTNIIKRWSLTPYEVAIHFSKLEILSDNLKKNIKNQNINLIKGSLDEINRLVKKLEKNETAQTLIKGNKSQ